MVKFIGSETPYIVALRDISEHIHQQNLEVMDNNKDVWVFTPSRMANKETRRLNRELGLHVINKTKERMAHFKNANDQTTKYKWLSFEGLFFALI